MTNYTASRPLQNKAAGDAFALGQTRAFNEVQAAFNRKTVMKGTHMVKRIEGALSATFPAIGKAKAKYHTPGTELTGEVIQSGEKVITLDDLLVADTFLDKVDLVKTYFDVASEYNVQLGDALAQTYDRNILSMLVKACRDGEAGATDSHGPAVSVNIGATPTTADLIDAIYDAQVAFDEGDVPEGDRYCFLSHADANKIGRDTTLTSGDFDRSGKNNLINGWVGYLAGFTLVRTNNLAVNHITETDYPDTAGNKYGVDATDTGMVFMQRGAIGTLEAISLTLEHVYQVERKGTLYTAHMDVGHGVLRPDLIREARKAV